MDSDRSEAKVLESIASWLDRAWSYHIADILQTNPFERIASKAGNNPTQNRSSTSLYNPVGVDVVNVCWITQGRRGTLRTLGLCPQSACHLPSLSNLRIRCHISSWSSECMMEAGSKPLGRLGSIWPLSALSKALLSRPLESKCSTNFASCFSGPSRNL